MEDGVLSCKACLVFSCEKGDEGVHILGVVLLHVAEHGAEDNGYLVGPRGFPLLGFQEIPAMKPVVPCVAPPRLKVSEGGRGGVAALPFGRRGGSLGGGRPRQRRVRPRGDR